MAQYIMTLATAYVTILFTPRPIFTFTLSQLLKYILHCILSLTQVYPALYITTYSSISCTIYYTYSSISCDIYYHLLNYVLHYILHLLKYILHYILPPTQIYPALYITLTQVYPALYITIYSTMSCTIYYT